VFGIGMTELLVILVVGLLVLGPKRLPELARSLGRGLAEFRRASNDMRREFLDVTEEVRREPVDDGLPGVDDPAQPLGALPDPSAREVSKSDSNANAVADTDVNAEAGQPKAETKGG
jgi:sec-independent protein translocase protein TatA